MDRAAAHFFEWIQRLSCLGEQRKVEVMLKVRLALATLGFATMLPTVPALIAQTPAAPLPSQIVTAKKVFIANTGRGFDSSAWTGGHDRMYNQFYADMNSWGRYELVSAPGDADLVLDVNVVHDSLSLELELEILDPKTGIVLWTHYEGVKIAVSQKNRDQNFDDTIYKLTADLKTLTAQPATGTN